MTEPVRPLEALIERWRSNASYLRALASPTVRRVGFTVAETQEFCANELEAALLQAAAPPAQTAEQDMRALHIAFTVAIRRTGGRLVACDGPDCRICAFVSASRKAAAPPAPTAEHNCTCGHRDTSHLSRWPRACCVKGCHCSSFVLTQSDLRAIAETAAPPERVSEGRGINKDWIVDEARAISGPRTHLQDVEALIQFGIRVAQYVTRPAVEPREEPTHE